MPCLKDGKEKKFYESLESQREKLMSTITGKIIRNLIEMFPIGSK